MPGTSGLLTPYGKMDGLYFDDSMEPDNFTFDFKKSIEKLVESKDVSYVKINFDTKEDYYKAMNMFREFNENMIHAYTTSKEDDMGIIVESELDLDDKDKEIKKENKK